MHISREESTDYVVLHLRGDFDSYYCPLFLEEIESTLEAGTLRLVINLRMVKFINSTALGAILKASKAVRAASGAVAISRPSPFCREIITKLGLDRLVPVFSSDVDALDGLSGEAPQDDGGGFFQEDHSAVLFTPTDAERVAHFIHEKRADNPVHGHAFGQHWTGVGRMAHIEPDELVFTWDGGKTDLTPFDMGQFLALGTRLQTKFRMPLLQRGHSTALGEISELEQRDDGVRVRLRFVELDDATRDAIARYASDMKFLKEELRQATD